MTFGLQGRGTTNGIAGHEFQQASLHGIKSACFGHQIAVDRIDCKLRQVTSRSDGEIVQDFLSMLAVDFAEEVLTAGIFLISLQRLSEGVVFIELLLERWRRVFDMLAQCC